jgi:hypothetical protein
MRSIADQLPPEIAAQIHPNCRKADATVLPWADCLALQLSPAQGVQSLLGGVAGGPAASLHRSGGA